jgi:hypothetical protein
MDWRCLRLSHPSALSRITDQTRRLSGNQLRTKKRARSFQKPSPNLIEFHGCLFVSPGRLGHFHSRGDTRQDRTN